MDIHIYHPFLIVISCFRQSWQTQEATNKTKSLYIKQISHELFHTKHLQNYSSSDAFCLSYYRQVLQTPLVKFSETMLALDVAEFIITEVEWVLSVIRQEESTNHGLLEPAAPTQIKGQPSPVTTNHISWFFWSPVLTESGLTDFCPSQTFLQKIFDQYLRSKDSSEV